MPSPSPVTSPKPSTQPPPSTSPSRGESQPNNIKKGNGDGKTVSLTGTGIVKYIGKDKLWRFAAKVPLHL